MSDATTATARVREYFKGSGMTPIAFEILKVEQLDDGVWSVVVQFFAWLGAVDVSKYVVRVSADGASVLGVDRA